MNKLCDGADWFRPDIIRIIREELAEPARFHRKQWEFAAIYRELEQLGVLNGETRGISFGSGTERLLYSVARRVKHLWATDLYAKSTTWDAARTSDPVEFVRKHAPFPYPADSLSAKHMDMREIDSPDNAFDFAYSSCAIEHIGHQSDFVRHLKEVHRVLKPGGAYVLTTELTYAPDAVEQEGNYYFSRDLLQSIVAESGLDSDPTFDAAVTPHAINTPIPVELSSGCPEFHDRLFESLVHLQLAVANTPFTSCLLVLRKSDARPSSFGGWTFDGWNETQAFIEQGLGRMRALVEESDLSLPPFAGMPERRSRSYAGHEDYFRDEPKAAPSAGNQAQVFHTPYVWLGRRERLIRAALTTTSKSDCALELKILRASVAGKGHIEPELIIQLRGAGGLLAREIPLLPRDDCRYALVASLKSGEGLLTDVHLTAAAAGAGPIWECAQASGQPTLISNLYQTAKELPPPGLRRLLRRFKTAAWPQA